MTTDASDDTTVLLVDDEAELADLYATLLEDEYDVRTATSGTEALTKVDETVDVALLDRRMPQMSGDELLAKLRERSHTLQVAMLTAVDPDVDILDMPFDDYKVKPVSKNELIGVVETLTQRATYNERSQELFNLASKKAALELENKDGTEEYEELVERMQTVRERVDETLDDVGTHGALTDLAGDTE